MRRLVEPHIQKLKPYQPGKPIEELERELGIEGAIKLASNENPLGAPPKARDALALAVSNAHLYPDASAHRLRERLSAHLGVPMDEIVHGNGSNELLTLLVRTFCSPGDHCVIHERSFIAYRVIMGAENVEWTEAELGEDFEPRIDTLLEAVRPETRILFLANPNNPTGTHVSATELERLLREVPEDVIVVLDEAYHEYVTAEDYASALTMRNLRERLVVLRTFSKAWGLAAARVGYGVSTPEIIDYINRVREPFDVNLLGQEAARAALDDARHIERSIEVNEEGRAVLADGLSSLGLRWIPSHTNFLLVQSPFDGVELYEALLRKGVIVRPLVPYGLLEYVRISIGTPTECERAIRALGEVLSEREAS